MSMIGEIRHRATTQHALHCAESGHLCVSTLHASNASQAVQRVLNFFSAPAQRQLLVGLSLSLQAVAAQRLVKSVQGSVVPAMEVMLLTPYVSELIQKSHADNRTDVTLPAPGLGHAPGDGRNAHERAENRGCAPTHPRPIVMAPATVGPRLAITPP